MMSPQLVYVAMAVMLVLMLIFSYISTRKMDPLTSKSFVSYKNSQTALRTAWCLFSAGTGCWTLFSFPEIGVLAGSWGVIGYTLSTLLGLTVLSMIGPYCRAMLGDGITFADFLHWRFGRVMQVYVACIALFFQFILLSSELTCVGDLTRLLAPTAMPEITIVTVTATTNLFMFGGLPASLKTNVVHGMATLTLVLVVCLAIFIHIDLPEGSWAETNIAAFTSDGFEVLVTLCIAITASNLFQTSYWQRVFAATDDKALKKGCWIAAFISVPFTVLLAFAGMTSYLAYPEGVYLFSLLVDMGDFWQFVVAMAIASLAFSVSNALLLGIVAELVTNFPQISAFYARAIALALSLPAMGIALKHYNILDLFLVADLLCTATVGPMLLAVWPRAHFKGALAGVASGLATIFLCGCGVQRSFVGGFEWFLLPEGLYSTNSMITFVLALTVPVITTIAVSLSLPPQPLAPIPVALPTDAPAQADQEQQPPTEQLLRDSVHSPAGTPTRRSVTYAAASTPPPITAPGLHMRLPPLSVAEDNA